MAKNIGNTISDELLEQFRKYEERLQKLERTVVSTSQEQPRPVPPAPDDWIIKTGTSGIDARDSSNLCSSEQCEVYTLDGLIEDSQKAFTALDPAGFTKRVFNLGDAPANGDTYYPSYRLKSGERYIWPVSATPIYKSFSYGNVSLAPGATFSTISAQWPSTLTHPQFALNGSDMLECSEDGYYVVFFFGQITLNDTAAFNYEQFLSGGTITYTAGGVPVAASPTPHSCRDATIIPAGLTFDSGNSLLYNLNSTAVQKFLAGYTCRTFISRHWLTYHDDDYNYDMTGITRVTIGPKVAGV